MTAISSDSAKVLLQRTAQINILIQAGNLLTLRGRCLIPDTLVGFAKSVFAGLLYDANKSWGLLGGLTQPLFAGGTFTARKRAAEAGAEAARVQYKSVVVTAFQNVDATLYAPETDEHSLAAAQDVEEANRQLAGHTQRQLEAGYISRLVFLAAQQSFLQARLARVASNATYLGDTVSLYQALGGGWRIIDTSAGLGWSIQRSAFRLMAQQH